MKQLSADEIQKLYYKFRQIIDKYVSGNNKQVILNELLPDFQQNILLSPASSKTYFNDAIPGG